MRTGRVLAVTAMLAALGAAVGGALGIVTIAFFILAKGGPPGVLTFDLFAPAAIVGAGVGVVLGPVAAWTLMRHVPIWKAIAGTALGTTIGVVGGYAIGSVFGLASPWSVFGGLLGFLVAAVVLRFRLPHAIRT